MIMHGGQRQNSGEGKLIHVNDQEYSKEPLRKISALQGVLELAGKFLTGIENVLGIYCPRTV